MTEEKWALFDFCETIVNFQTADSFVDFVCKRNPSIRIHIISFILKILNRLKFFRILDVIYGSELYLLKKCKLRMLKGFSEKNIDELSVAFYESLIEPNFIVPIIERLKNLKNSGYKILVVSGGYSIYIRHFIDRFNLDGLIANDISFKNGVCKGNLNGYNCMNERKPFLLDSFFKTRPFYSEAYSDSVTDVPFLKWAHKGIVVSKNRHQQWADNFNFEEIIWND